MSCLNGGCKVSALTFLLACFCLFSSCVNAVAVKNQDPDFLKVYVNNVENLLEPNEECKGDWQNLLYYIRDQELKPDLFIIQQVSGHPQATELATRMQQLFDEEYGVLVVPVQKKKQGSPCGKEKQYQKNAIIYRTGRLLFNTSLTWQSSHKKDGACINNTQNRSINILARFLDATNGKHVNVVSMHFPTNKLNGPACADENITETNSHASNIAANLIILAGDANVADLKARSSKSDWEKWYKHVNGSLGGSLGYRDAIYDNCSEGIPSPSTIPEAARQSLIKKCILKSNWTTKSKKRIDFLFAKRPNATMPFIGAEHTITYKQAARSPGGSTKLNYSEHRAIRARIHY